MPVFLAIPLKTDSAALNKAVEAKFMGTIDRYKLQADAGWLINYSGTTVELCNFLGITGQESGEHSLIGSAMVVPVTTYYGRGPSNMWEWIKTRLET